MSQANNITEYGTKGYILFLDDENDTEKLYPSLHLLCCIVIIHGLAPLHADVTGFWNSKILDSNTL